jgi:hypothetical protein
MTVERKNFWLLVLDWLVGLLKILAASAVVLPFASAITGKSWSDFLPPAVLMIVAFPLVFVIRRHASTR